MPALDRPRAASEPPTRSAQLTANWRGCEGHLASFGADRLEAAATRAIEIGTLTYGSVRSILGNKLDRQAAQRPSANDVPILHPNIGGPRYYH